MGATEAGAARAETTCPSSLCAPGHQLLGIVRPDGTVAALRQPLTVDAEFAARASAPGLRPPEARFRFAGPCVGAACIQWEGAVLSQRRDGGRRPRARPPDGSRARRSTAWRTSAGSPGPSRKAAGRTRRSGATGRRASAGCSCTSGTSASNRTRRRHSGAPAARWPLGPAGADRPYATDWLVTPSSCGTPAGPGSPRSLARSPPTTSSGTQASPLSC